MKTKVAYFGVFTALALIFSYVETLIPFNFGIPGVGPKLKPGMVICIEPMLTFGHRDIYVLEDEWTVVTQDGSNAAHYEHTIAITKEGPIILTGEMK